MSRREQIVDTALTLFNESGTGPISTNHIAQALGISPGNLYYHFRNKEEIVLAIFDRMERDWNSGAGLPADRAPQVGDLLALLTGSFGVLWEYRFYYRELLALLARDPELARRYRAMRTRGLGDVAALVRHYAATGLIHLPAEPGAADDLARTIWLMVDFWLPFEELGGATIGPADLLRGARFVLHMLRPYLAPKALADLARFDDAPTRKE